MRKLTYFVVLVALVLSVSNSGYSLQCYHCDGCDELEREQDQTCRDGEECAVYDIALNMGSAVDIVKMKGCRPAGENCEEVMYEEIEQAVETIKQIFPRIKVQAKCNTCDQDFCNV